MKKGRPPTWSKWEWVKNRSASTGPDLSICWPRSRKPLPPSNIKRRAPQRTSKHEVLPPYLVYSIPGHAMLPRTPQNLTKKEGSSDNPYSHLRVIPLHTFDIVTLSPCSNPSKCNKITETPAIFLFGATRGPKSHPVVYGTKRYPPGSVTKMAAFDGSRSIF